MTAWVLYSAGIWRRPGRPGPGLIRRIQITRRFPRRVYRHILARLVRIGSWSHIAHVAIAYDGAVLDPSLLGIRYFPLIPYVQNHPSLLGWHEVHISRPLDLDAYSAGYPSVILTIFWRLTLGYLHATNCVTVVSRALYDGGLDVPRLTSPAALHRWLGAHGCHYEDLGRLPGCAD